MTGFGKSILQLPNKKITIEIKSLNSKNLDFNARIPSQYKEKELKLKNTIAKSLVRGKIDFSIFIESTGEETTNTINANAVKNYIEQLKQIVDGDETELLKMAVRMPDALKTQREEIDTEEFLEIENSLEEALSEIINFRKSEGAALKEDLDLRTETIKRLLNDIIVMDPQRIAAVKERLLKAVSELKENVDENRFEQELIYYIEKFDITEEKVRLEKHLSYFQETVNQEGANGKKLGFISQEIGREINTIGSKANFAPMQQLVVQMKDELEKIKEQLLNVL